jgi:hypothetical protein
LIEKEGSHFVVLVPWAVKVPHLGAVAARVELKLDLPRPVGGGGGSILRGEGGLGLAV